jgi:gluconolactonase
MTLPLTVRPFVDGLDHPEGVAWGPDGFVYAGGEAGQIYRVSLDGELTQIATTGGFLLGLCLDADANVYGCDMGRREVVRVTPAGKVTTYSTGPAEHPLRNPNWPVFAADGTLYVSDSGTWGRNDGRVLALRPGGDAVLLRDDVRAFPNGLALHPDNGRLYCAETSAARIVRMPVYGARSYGPIEQVLRMPERTLPDGLAFDAQGGLLIACYTPDVIYRLAPDGQLHVLAEDWQRLALASPTNVAFCGPDLRTLAIASLGRWHLAHTEVTIAGARLHYPRS